MRWRMDEGMKEKSEKQAEKEKKEKKGEKGKELEKKGEGRVREGVVGENVEAVKEIISAVHSQLFFLLITHCPRSTPFFISFDRNPF